MLEEIVGIVCFVSIEKIDIIKTNMISLGERLEEGEQNNMNTQHVVRAYEQAREHGYTVKQIATEIGTSANNLSNIITRHKAPGYNPRKQTIYWRKLIRWLEDGGFLSTPSIPAPDTATVREDEPEYENAIRALAEDCENLARYLRDPRHSPDKHRLR